MAKFAQRLASAGKIRKLHFCILPRQNNSGRTRTKGRQHGRPYIRWLSAFLIQPGRNIDVDAGVDGDRAFDIGNGSSRLLRHVVRRESRRWQSLQTRFVVIAEDLAVDFKNLFRRAIAKTVD